MEKLTNNSSDSDLSDDWSIINTKDAPPVVSESESIEVIDDDDNEINIDTDKETEDNCDEDNKSNERLDEVGTAATSNLEFPVSRLDEFQVVPDRGSRYCVFPEEFHDVFTLNQNSITTSELLCSISLVILCTVASSFMVISADNLRPSFIDVLAWQSLPDYQKDMSNLGLINQQLQERNAFLENKFNHLSLAVKAFEENMISDAALAEFVTDLQKSMGIDNLSSDKPSHHVSEAIFSSISSALPKSQSTRESVDENFNSTIDQTVKNNRVPDQNLNTDKVTEEKSEKRTDIPSSNFGKATKYKKPVKMLSSVLSLFNTTSETGVLLNKASLLLLNSKDRLLIFKRSVQPSDLDNKGNLKFNKLSNRLDNIESNINRDIDKFFNQFSKRIYSSVVNFDKTVNDYICKNRKIIENTRLNELCSPNKEYNSYDNDIKNKNKFKRDKLYRKRESNVKNNIKKSKLSVENTRSDNIYEIDGDAIGKSKDQKLNTESEKTASEYTFNRFSDETLSEIKHFNNRVDDLNNKQIRRTLRQSSEQKIINEDKRTAYGSKKTNDQHIERIKDEVKMNDEKNKPENSNLKHSAREKTLNVHHDESVKETEKDETDNVINSNIKRHASFDKYDRITFKKLKKTANYKEESHKNKQDSGKQFYQPSRILNNSNKGKNSFKVRSKNWETEAHDKGPFLDEKPVLKNHKKQKDSPKEKDKYESKMRFNDVRKVKEDILNSIHRYIDELLTDYSSYYNQNNSTSFAYSKILPGDWFLTLGKKRSELRDKVKESDWLFSRAEGRHSLRDLNSQLPFDSTLYEKTYWFFRRAWERNRIRS